MQKLLVCAVALLAAGVMAATAAADTHVVVRRNTRVHRLFTGLTDCQAYG